MAIASNYIGQLVGYREYTKDNKLTCTYLVLVSQRPDPVTKLPTEAQVFEVKEETQVLKELKNGVKVTFWEEERHRGKDAGGGTYKVCIGIEAV